jgi:hypothetical protein
MHGGTNPGAPTGKRHGNYRSGVWTKEWMGRVGNIASIIRRASAGLRECSLTGAMSTLGGCAPGAGAGMSPLTPISGVRAG